MTSLATPFLLLATKTQIALVDLGPLVNDAKNLTVLVVLVLCGAAGLFGLRDHKIAQSLLVGVMAMIVLAIRFLADNPNAMDSAWSTFFRDVIK